MPPLTALLRLTLALAFAIGGTGLMMVRAQAPAATTLVLCTGEGDMGLSLDARGNPVVPGHPCPDCILAGWAVLPGFDLPPRPTLRADLSTAPIRLLPLAQSAPQPQARGPPRLS